MCKARGRVVGQQVSQATAPGPGLAACRKGLTAGFTTASALVNELTEARDEVRPLNMLKMPARLRLLSIDEPGFVPLSRAGVELLFEVVSQGYERASIVVTTNRPFDQWAGTFGSERLTGALPDRLTHHVHIIGDELGQLPPQSEQRDRRELILKST